MDLEFSTTQVEPQPILGIRTQAKMQDLPNIMGNLFGEVFGYVTQSGEQPAGMPFSRYHSMDNESVDMECGLPVRSAKDGTTRIQSGELPGGTVATVIHKGPYDDLPRTWSALFEWIGAQGLKPAGAPWEVYLTDPGAEPDPSQWRTQIFFPVQ